MRSLIIQLILITSIGTQVSAQIDSVLYHDGQMESQWGSSTNGDYFGCFVRITPPAYPAFLRGIRGYFRNGDANSTVKWKVYTDPNGLAMGGVNMAYLSPAAFPNPSAGGNGNQDYTAYVDLTNSNIAITNGDVYVGAVQSVGFFGAGIDNLPNNAVAVNRQWQWMYVFGSNYWNTLASQASAGQFGFTAFFDAFPNSVSQPGNDPVNIYLEQTENILHVDLPMLQSTASVKIFDVTGKLLMEKNISTEISSIPFFQPGTGIYLVRISYGGKEYHRKIVVN